MQELDKEDAVQMIDQFKMENEALEKKWTDFSIFIKNLKWKKWLKTRLRS